jgi:hypothetical protein
MPIVFFIVFLLVLLATLTERIRNAKAELGKDSALVRLCQRRTEKFRGKHRKAKKSRDRAEKIHKAKKVAFYEARMARAARKIRFWHERELDAIEVAHDAKGALARLLKKKAAAQPLGAKLIATANKYVGTVEGSKLQVDWAHKLGFSADLPWCSIFVANMLIEAGILTRDQLPSNPAYSGIWIGADHFRRINRAEARAGDLLIFDWGDGGITDHVGIWDGDATYTSGNHGDKVDRSPVYWGNVVAIVRVVG